MLPAHHVQCPYCGERIELLVDPTVDAQRYIEDCPVCCRPIAVHVVIDSDHGSLRIEARRDDE